MPIEILWTLQYWWENEILDDEIWRYFPLIFRQPSSSVSSLGIINGVFFPPKWCHFNLGNQWKPIKLRGICSNKPIERQVANVYVHSLLYHTQTFAVRYYHISRNHCGVNSHQFKPSLSKLNHFDINMSLNFIILWALPILDILGSLTVCYGVWRDHLVR